MCNNCGNCKCQKKEKVPKEEKVLKKGNQKTTKEEGLLEFQEMSRKQISYFFY